MSIYKFHPQIKRAIWGRETWTVSAIAGSESVVAEGDEVGCTLGDIVEKHGAALLGKKNYERFGDNFPLLIKFIDANLDLSIQVHPTDGLAKQRGFTFGKNEIWYVMSAEFDATMIVGFKEKLSKEDYAKVVEDGTFEKYVNRMPVHAGDVFYIPAGRVHGIGGGVRIAEIQQTSDLTYRIYDYHRKDKNGNERQLHTELAKEAINFDDVTEDPRTKYSREADKANLLEQTHDFTVAYSRIDKGTKFSTHDSFVILICTRGIGQVNDELINQGDVVLISADMGEFECSSIENFEFIQTYIDL